MYPAILSAFYSTPWAILPEKLEEIRAFLKLKAAGGQVEPAAAAALAATRRPDGVQMFGRVAVLPVFGVIAQRLGMMERISGGVSTEELGATLDTLVRDQAVKAIVMAYDTPGGTVPGVMELAARIRAARDVKKIVAFVDPLAASAGYWLAAQASEVVITPSGRAGSVGVIFAYEDRSKADEMAGVNTTFITSSPYKAELWQPLTEEARAHLQREADTIHAQFVGDVARGRGVAASKVEKTFGQGRVLNAEDALAAGMVDKVGTLDLALRRAGGAEASGAGPAPLAQAAAARARVVAIEAGG